MERKLWRRGAEMDLLDSPLAQWGTLAWDPDLRLEVPGRREVIPR